MPRIVLRTRYAISNTGAGSVRGRGFAPAQLRQGAAASRPEIARFKVHSALCLCACCAVARAHLASAAAAAAARRLSLVSTESSPQHSPRLSPRSRSPLERGKSPLGANAPSKSRRASWADTGLSPLRDEPPYMCVPTGGHASGGPPHGAAPGGGRVLLASPPARYKGEGGA
eukprot:1066709-Rhodomonas_salina.2